MRRRPRRQAVPAGALPGVVEAPLVPTLPAATDPRLEREPPGTFNWHTMSPAARAKLQAALTAMEADLGGRQAVFGTLVDASAASALTPDLAAKARQLAELLAQPKWAERSLGALARRAGVSLTDLLTLYKEARLFRAHLQALHTVAARIPETVADIMRRSAPYEDACGACSGIGEITQEPSKKHPNPGPEPCPSCRGSGRLRYPADPTAQEQALQLAGLLKGGGGGIAIDIRQQTLQHTQHQTVFATAGSVASLFSRVQAVSDRMLYGSARRAVGAREEEDREGAAREELEGDEAPPGGEAAVLDADPMDTDP